jgi:hypothetical protein
MYTLEVKASFPILELSRMVKSCDLDFVDVREVDSPRFKILVSGEHYNFLKLLIQYERIEIQDSNEDQHRPV